MIRAKVNLLDPEEVKLFIKRNKNWSDGHKVNAVYAYNDFCKMMKIEWEKPVYQWKETLPFVPTEKETDALIAGTGKKVSTLLQALKDSLKNANYPTVFRHTTMMQKEELILSNKALRKDGKPDKRNTKILKLSPKGYAKLLIEGDLKEEELREAVIKILQRDYADLFLPDILNTIIVDKIFADILLKTRYKINLEFFNEDYFYEVFYISFAESFFENIKEFKEPKKITSKARARKLKKKYVLPVLEDLKNLQKLFKLESTKFNNYSKALGMIIQEIE